MSGKRKRRPAPGSKAPTFALPDQRGKVRRLSDYRGRWLLLYFYPKDATPGCTKEACGLRDGHETFGELGASVVGVSVDPVASHEKFARKHELPFPLLADTERVVVRRYGVWGPKQFMGRKYEGTHRVSFLIDPEGRIARVYDKVRPAEHAEQVLGDLRSEA